MAEVDQTDLTEEEIQSFQRERERRYFTGAPPMMDQYPQLVEDGEKGYRQLGEAVAPLFERTCGGRVGTLRAWQVLYSTNEIEVIFFFYF